MDPTLRKHAGAALVAVAVVVAALVDGSFGPTAYAAASILIWAAVIAGLAGRALPSPLSPASRPRPESASGHWRCWLGSRWDGPPTRAAHSTKR